MNPTAFFVSALCFATLMVCEVLVFKFFERNVWGDEASRGDMNEIHYRASNLDMGAIQEMLRVVASNFVYYATLLSLRFFGALAFFQYVWPAL